MTAANAQRTDGWTFETKVHFGAAARGRKRLLRGEAPPPAALEPGRLPRVTRLLALAHRFDGLVRDGVVADQTDLARLAGVTRQRISQLMSLLRLAPDIQEELVDLPRTLAGRDEVTERDLRAIVAEPVWSRQRELWRAVRASAAPR
jgi:hypothetical protein